ncbi:sialate O-acetylesterase [candidate division KSB1 bacterium]|nr:sialate O-acetylesterase [candidate division KSB1 bacterium]
MKLKSTFIFVFTISLLLCCGSKNGEYLPGSIEKENFHLYLLIGQSNMAGRGEVAAVDTIPHPRVYALNRDNQWVPAQDPVHFDKPIAGVGPGLPFGKRMAELNPGIVIGLIPCAKGGSKIHHWRTGVYHDSTYSYPYDEMLERTRSVLDDGILKGVLWHQGEGNSLNKEYAEDYEEKLIAFVEQLRKDLKHPELPFIAAELGVFLPERFSQRRTVTDAIRNLPRRLRNTAVVSSKGLTAKGDSIHFNSASARLLGERYAEMMCKVNSKSKQGIDHE